MDIQGILKREINLPKDRSFFLFGARQVRKPSLIKALFNAESTKRYNLRASLPKT